MSEQDTQLDPSLYDEKMPEMPEEVPEPEAPIGWQKFRCSAKVGAVGKDEKARPGLILALFSEDHPGTKAIYKRVVKPNADELSVSTTADGIKKGLEAGFTLDEVKAMRRNYASWKAIERAFNLPNSGLSLNEVKTAIDGEVAEFETYQGKASADGQYPARVEISLLSKKKQG